MTLILAIPTPEGIVMASDTQYTSGEVRSSGPKIYPLSAQAAWGGAGEVALIQRVQEALADLPTHHSLAELRDTLARTVQQAIRALLELDVLTEFVQTDPNLLLSLHPGDFLFAEFAAEGPRLLHIAANGTPEWVTGCFAIGNGANFAYALLQKYQQADLNLAQAVLLAYRVIAETVQVGAFGLDFPIDLWLIHSRGLSCLEAHDFEQLALINEQLAKKELRLLKHIELPFASRLA